MGVPSGITHFFRMVPKIPMNPKFDSWPIEMLYDPKISKIVGIEFDSWTLFVGKIRVLLSE